MRTLPRPALGLLAALALAAVPSAAQARTAVIGVDRADHVLRTVDTATGAVRSARYHGRLARSVRPGAAITAKRRGRVLRDVRRVGALSRVSVPGTVVAEGPTGTTVMLGDGRPLNIALTVNGLEAGRGVIVELRFTSSGGVAIVLTLLPAAAGEEDEDPVLEEDDDADPAHEDGEEEHAPAADCRQDGVRGRVLGVNQRRGVFSIARTWGDEETYPAAPALLATVREGAVVLVHLAVPGTADGVTVLPDGAAPEFDGTVVRISDEAEQITIAPRGGGARVSFDAPCWVRASVFRAEDVHLVARRGPAGDLVVVAVDANDGSTL